ncbi:hypothetical protein BGZ60DRAFT_540185 [Tricladium varicosporioides]|nr:hypothetical protein BGZ60DRAFT_540185 [Hymenoscyphus varicosporioides]
MKTTFVLAAAASLLTPTSAWKVWINWNNACGGDSYFTQAAYGKACLNVVPHSDGSLPRSFTYFTTGESGCTASIFSGTNCVSSGLIDATKSDGACLAGRFASYSVLLFREAGEAYVVNCVFAQLLFFSSLILGAFPRTQPQLRLVCVSNYEGPKASSFISG